jgi:methylmalonyl-CoA/ethylmalonyl-CoA epimerase
MSRLLAIILATWPVLAQVPEFYRSVDRVTWVVDDLDRVTSGWDKVGFLKIENRGDIEMTVTFRGQPTKAKVRMATGFLGDVRVTWIQPLGGVNAFAEYQKKHVSGVFSLVHRVPTLEAYNQELERLHALGVAVLQSGENYAYLDTYPEGKYVLGLIYVPDGVVETAADVPPTRKIMQFAFTVHDLKPVSAYWAKLGLGAMALNSGNLSDVQYWGKPIEIQQNFGWQRGRKVVYEWLQPVTSPNVFDDHMKAHGEGIHHIAVTTPDMEKAVAEWTATGLKVASSGRWGQRDKPGSGRFTYVDTEPIGGVTTELLWNYR